MRSRHWIVLFALGPASAFASGDGCEFRADRAAGIDAKGIEKVVIRAGAGDMKVVGSANAVRVEARGVACAGKQETLDKTQISVRREGNVVIVETTLPQNDDGWAWVKNDYAYIDIGIALPSGLPVDATDSSGDAVFDGMKELVVQDSSGDLRVTNVAGPAQVTDSSGDLTVEHAGSVQVRDSSGDMLVRDVRGNVDVILDSSGDIQVVDVNGSVKIEQDSSGGIRIENVKGSVDVNSDSSGDIYAARVSGDFTVGEDSSGSIEHEAIGGRVTVPSNKQED